MMNKFIGIGRLCKDVETRIAATKDGDITIARYTIAIDRKGKKDETDFISCVCFGKTAEFAEKYLAKGMKVAIEGRIQTGSYEKDGRKVAWAQTASGACNVLDHALICADMRFKKFIFAGLCRNQVPEMGFR